MLTTVLINENSRVGMKAEAFFEKTPHKVIRSRNEGATYDIVKSELTSGKHLFILCGGDGTVNNFLQAYMKFPSKVRKNIFIGIIPCGKANDLANELQILTSISEAYNMILKENSKTIDLIRVNQKYFVTGGGLGLSTQVADKANKIAKTIPLIQSLKSQIYSLLAVKKILFGYKSVSISQLNGKATNIKCMTVGVHNQESIGKRFKITPQAKNTDGLLDVCLIRKQSNPMSEIKILLDVIKGKKLVGKADYFQMKKANIVTTAKTPFMGDGEILDSSKKFDFEVLPKAISIFH